MPQITARVHVENHFQRVTDDVRRLARDAADEGAKVGGAAAAAIAAQRSETGAMAAIRIEPAVPRESTGWVAAFVSPVYYAWFQNFGTLGSRKRALKRQPTGNRTRDPGTGIKPLHFLEAGRRAGRKAMIARLERGL